MARDARLGAVLRKMLPLAAALSAAWRRGYPAAPPFSGHREACKSCRKGSNTSKEPIYPILVLIYTD